MRVRKLQKFSLLAVAVVAGLSLTACEGGTDSAADAGDSSVGSASSQGTGGSDSSGSGSTGSTTSSNSSDGNATSGSSGSSSSSGGSGSSAVSACKTAELGFSTSHGMGEGDLIVNLKNNSSHTCTMQGFPGVDLKSNYGTISAARTDLSAPAVSVAAGEETRFTLHYVPNASGGSGVTYTQILVTPPNETHSTSLPVGINVAVADDGSDITVDPVGTGK